MLNDSEAVLSFYSDLLSANLSVTCKHFFRFSASPSCCVSSADSGAALRLLGGQRPLCRSAQSPGEEVHHARVAAPFPHPSH